MTDREWEWEGMGMSIWENIGNENKCLAGMGMEMGLKLLGMGKNGKAESHSRTPLSFPESWMLRGDFGFV